MSLLSFVMPRMFGESFEGIKMLFSNYSKMVRFLLFCVFHSFISLFFHNFRKDGGNYGTNFVNDVTEDDCRLHRLFVTFKRLLDELKQN